MLPAISSFIILLLLPTIVLTFCTYDNYEELGNGRCYQLFRNYSSYDMAESTCENNNGTLLSIHSEKDNTMFSNWLTNVTVDMVWIGLVCLNASDCQWADGTPLDYNNFVGNTSDISHGNCFYLQVGKEQGKTNPWLDDKCRYPNYFVCEENEPVPSCGDYTQLGDNCYSVKKDSINQTEAEEVCTSEGGHLASIGEQRVNDLILHLFTNNSIGISGWIGLEYSNGTYTWTDETEYNYTKVDGSTPTDGSCFAMCIPKILCAGQWKEEDCGLELPFICRRDKMIHPPTTNKPPVLSTSTVSPPVSTVTTRGSTVVGITSTPQLRTSTTTTTSSSKCGMSQYTGQSGSIRSPNYPYNFGDGFCQYTISGSSNAVNLQIPLIKASGHWVMNIYDGTQPNPGRKIKTISSLDILKAWNYSSPSSQMFITFYADLQTRGNSFQMLYTSTSVPQYSLGDLGATLSPTNFGTNCQGWIFDSNRNICYQLFSPTNLDGALTNCRNENAKVLSIHNDSEEQSLRGIFTSYFLGKGYQVWLGAKYSYGSSSWSWLDNTVFAYTDWISGEPHLTSGNCLTAMNDPAADTFGWTVTDCSVQRQYLCYRPPTN